MPVVPCSTALFLPPFGVFLAPFPICSKPMDSGHYCEPELFSLVSYALQIPFLHPFSSCTLFIWGILPASSEDCRKKSPPSHREGILQQFLVQIRVVGWHSFLNLRKINAIICKLKFILFSLAASLARIPWWPGSHVSFNKMLMSILLSDLHRKYLQFVLAQVHYQYKFWPLEGSTNLHQCFLGSNWISQMANSHHHS